MPCDYCPYGIVCDFANSDQEKLRCIQKNDAQIWDEIICSKKKKKNNKKVLDNIF